MSREPKELRRAIIAEDFCPECLGELDTGWECNVCGYDAKDERDKTEKAKGPQCSCGAEGYAAEHDASCKAVRK